MNSHLDNSAIQKWIPSVSIDVGVQGGARIIWAAIPRTRGGRRQALVTEAGQGHEAC